MKSFSSKIELNILLINILSIFLILTVFCPENASPINRLRSILAFTLLFPGYLLLNAIFPHKNTLNLEEKWILGIPISIATLEFIGLALNSIVGIQLSYYSLFLIFLIFIASLVTLYRRSKFKIIQRGEVQNKIGEIRGYIILLLISLPFLILYFQIGVASEYSYRHWAFVELSRDLNHMNPLIETQGYGFSFVSLYPGHDMVLLSITKFSALSVQTLQFLPITGVALTLIFYLLSKRFLGSSLIALVLAIATIPLDTAYSLQYNPLWYYSLTVLFYLSFVYFLLKYFESRRVEFIPILLFVFVGAFFMHHRVPFWMILTLVGTNLYSFLISLLRDKKVKGTNFNLLLAFTVVYLGFNRVLYEQYLPNIFEMSMAEGFATLSSSIMELIGYSTTTIKKYMYPPSPAYLYSADYSAIAIFKYVVIILPVIIFIGYIVTKAIKNGVLEIDTKDPKYLLFCSLLFTSFFEEIPYFIMGRVSLTFISTVFPILAIFSIKELRIPHNVRKKILIVFVIILITTSMGKFVAAKDVNFNMLNLSYDDISSSSSWLENVSEGGTYKIISDLRVWGMYLVEGAKNDIFPEYIYIKHHDYANLVENRPLPQESYFILNKKDFNRTVILLFWDYFEPFSLHYQEINSNQYLNKIYVSNSVEIYKTL